MQYSAVVTLEAEDWFLIDFPDLPGCCTEAPPGYTVEHMGSECLQVWLEADLLDHASVVPPPRRHRAPKNGELRYFRVPALLAARIQLRQARAEAGITQAELARRIGVSQQQIAKLEHPDGDLKISTLERAARALGLSLDINLVNDAA